MGHFGAEKTDADDGQSHENVKCFINHHMLTLKITHFFLCPWPNLAPNFFEIHETIFETFINGPFCIGTVFPTEFKVCLSNNLLLARIYYTYNYYFSFLHFIITCLFWSQDQAAISDHTT